MRRLLVGLVVLTTVLAGCTSRSSGPSASSTTSTSTGTSAGSASGDFGTLKNVCQGGTPGASGGNGVTASEIKLGVLTDMGFTKSSEFPDAAKVFTSWCNAAGGVNGRKLVPDTLDTAMMQVPQKVTQACKDDFALVGGGAALDGTAVQVRLGCLLSDYPAQSSMSVAEGSDLQVLNSGASVGWARYTPYWSWLIKQAYPDSAASVGVIAGDSPVTKDITAQTKEGVAGIGGTVTYSDLYPAAGVADWTPYAEAIKNKNVKGLIFWGDYRSLATLEQALLTIGYKPDWIDTNSNAYTPAFIQLAGSALGTQNNYADIEGLNPVEAAADDPATQQVVNLFAKYSPGTKVTMPELRAFSAWLLFATAASSCTDLTPKCVYDNAVKQTAWTAGGLQAPIDLSSVSTPLKCFNVVKATPTGWTVPDFKANTGPYRCGDPVYKYSGTYTKPLTLTAIGKSMADFK